MMFRHWQSRFLIGLLDIAVTGNSKDKWANYVSERLGRSLSKNKGEIPVSVARDIDRIVGVLPFRNASLIVLALNSNRSFDPVGLPNINNVASKLHQLYRFSETFSTDRLAVINEQLSRKIEEV